MIAGPPHGERVFAFGDADHGALVVGAVIGAVTSLVNALSSPCTALGAPIPSATGAGWVLHRFLRERRAAAVSA
ncbi:hypothetical protein [Actinacidiphila sp. bgisy167]|uniref:hypothetical protein n=1 Tax=Actinacidiphila sp. bgisy167 TaxID=3413797 RepID=UPI003D746999